MATTNAPGTMERILRLMAEKKASDVYLSANSPALIKINGQCVPINNQSLPFDAPKNLLAEILPPERMAELEAEGELNMGFPIAGLGRFRVSAMRQRGSVAAVFRYIAVDVPALADLFLPPILGDLIMEKRGLMLMVGAKSCGSGFLTDTWRKPGAGYPPATLAARTSSMIMPRAAIPLFISDTPFYLDIAI